MTVFHYIASKRELPTGWYGQKAKLVPISDVSDIKIKGAELKKTKKNKYVKPLNSKENYIIEFETEEDFLGISVSELESHDEITNKFNNTFLYHLDCSDHRKCYRDLFKYIAQNLVEDEKIELYTCQDGDELKPRDASIDVIINLKSKHYTNCIGNFKLDERRLFEELSERFSLRERQYVVVSK